MASEATPPRLRKRDRVKKAIKRVFRRDQALHGTEVVTSHTATTVPVQLVKTVHDADANSKAESEIKSRTTDDAAAAAAMSTAAHVEDASAQAADGPAQVEEDAEVEDAAEALLSAVHRQFEGELQAEEERWLTKTMAEVYVARGKTSAKAERLMCDATRWRIDRRAVLASRECPACAGDRSSHDARIFGQDAAGDAVFMNCFALSTEFTPQGVTDHMACLFERAIEHFPPSSEEERLRWTWVVDVHGFALRHTNPATSIELLQLLECAYPERLKRMLIVDAPSLFFGLWNVIKPLLREKTRSKIEFVRWEEASGRYEDLFGHEVAQRLVTEGRENRDKAVAGQKCWTTFYADPAAYDDA